MILFLDIMIRVSFRGCITHTALGIGYTQGDSSHQRIGKHASHDSRN